MSAEVTIPTLKDREAYDKAMEVERVAIDFTASWCPPCKRIGPVFAVRNFNIFLYQIMISQIDIVYIYSTI